VNRALVALERGKTEFAPAATRRKLAAIARLEKARLTRAREVERYHEALCFLRAYPDSPRVLRAVERALERFASRADLKRHAAALADSGIAGTPISYPFFAPTAQWLAERWPELLHVDWDYVQEPERLEKYLPLLVHYGESPAIDEFDFPLRDWLSRLKARRETDAAFVVRRLRQVVSDAFLFERVYEDLGLVLRLEARARGRRRTPARSFAKVPTGQTCAFQTGPLRHGRPDLRRAARETPLAVRQLDRARGQAMIDLAREAMVTRERDLDAFSWGSPSDVRLVEWEDGLAFAVVGVIPERRLLLEAVYAFLTLKNGVPIGYVLNSALYRSAEIAYNVFATYRGAEAAHIYGRVLATVRHLFHGVDAFTIYPYQLGGAGNQEGLASGAWWFYQKLGFRPREARAVRRMNRELAAMRRDPEHRSSSRTLAALAEANMYLFLGEERDEVIGMLPLLEAGLVASRRLAAGWAFDRQRAGIECRCEAGRLLGIRHLEDWTEGEKLALWRWSPLVLEMPALRGWTASEKESLAEVIRAKGGERESDFVRRFDVHPKLGQALAQLVRRAAGRD
jgi:hypothetical protein